MSVYSAAIDFGTTYSGYAFSFTVPTDNLADIKIYANQKWYAGNPESCISLKTPTCILLKKEKDKDNTIQIKAFGYEAENQYSEIALGGDADDYYFFYRFKMNLYKENISKGMLLKDVTEKKKLPAVQVFSLFIQALVDHMKKTVTIECIAFDVSKTKWVLTVPAIWSDAAKSFMRKCAEMAGITSDLLIIALEPEAASIYSQIFPTAGNEYLVKPGSKYLVVDLGGGTIDINAHEKLHDGTLKELTKASGNHCGGTSVDSKYIDMLTQILGEPVIKSMKEKHPDFYLTMVRSFESVKRIIEPKTSGFVNLSITYASLNSVCQTNLGKSVDEVFKNSVLASKVKLVFDKIRIEASYTRSLFDETIGNIVLQITEALSDTAAKEIKDILLIGGFSECHLIQEAVKLAFLDYRIIVPQGASLAVLKGAVLFGYKQDSISSRITRYTYGVEVVKIFDEAKDDIKRKIYSRDHQPLLDNVFQPFMKIKQSVSRGQQIRHTYSTSEEFQNTHFLPIYYTFKEDVEFTDDGKCMKLGEVEVEIPNPTKHVRDVDVIFTFGDTELTVTAVDVETGKKCRTSFEIEDFK